MRWRSSSSSSSLPLLLLFSSSVLLLLSSSSLVDGKETKTGIRICAYNVPNFNSTKTANHRLMYTLMRVVSSCDICLLQGVAPDNIALKSLLKHLNGDSDRYDQYKYEAVASKPLGAAQDDMQQYVFMYRLQTVEVVDQHQYESRGSFVRPPLAVQFQTTKAAMKKFVLVPLHSDPTQAVQEINRLYDVFREVSVRWNNTNVMFLGDFHAGCAYMTRADKKNIRLFTNSSFFWLIKDKVDTTVSEDTNCAYDRIVVFGEPLLKAIVPFSAKVYEMRKELQISMTKVLEVSDHFPVEVTLKSSAHFLCEATPPLTLLSVFAVLWSFLSDL